MTQEDKKLLYKDLAARQPYRPFICFVGKVTMPFLDVIANTESNELMSINGLGLDDVKVYLRPMSTMTEEEVKEIRKINWQFWKPKNDSDECFVGDADDGYCSVSQMARIINYLNAHHFDYNGLIPMGLALEAPEGMYKTE